MLAPLLVVFPTHVGVFPLCPAHHPPTIRLPHARGGVSTPSLASSSSARSSPRTWGCFSLGGSAWVRKMVFPTHVGVFLTSPGPRSGCGGLPHARGGVSGCSEGADAFRQSSPRTWGCFPLVPECSRPGAVFPTHVGVFLTLYDVRQQQLSLPHARGGVSDCEQGVWRSHGSSPRTWGCFRPTVRRNWSSDVFPTHVGVFLRFSMLGGMPSGLPHARGGVSW